jgi:DNA-binding NtrC family response regulator
MPSGRIKASELAKVLQATSLPIYILDADRTLVFCNSSLIDWLGCSEDELLGTRCAYHSDPQVTGAEAVAAGLCPPVEALAGQEMSGVITRTAAEGAIARRRARFIPLRGTGEEIVGLVALVETTDLPDIETPVPVPGQSEAQWLHERLQVYHRQRASRLRADRLIGESLLMRRVRAQAAVAAGTNANVLLFGPAGSGRQRIAEAIHYAGEPSVAGSLVPLACAMLNSELIYSTIKALAFKESVGKEASRNTLLLNDVDCLAVDVQALLAELFSSKSWRLRLIATARQPFEDAVRQGKFRQDLAMLLSTIVIAVPPLAGHRDDIPLLAQMFLEQSNARGTRQLAGFLPEALDRLCAYQWPGNVDELAEVVSAAHSRAEGNQISATDLPEQIHLAADAEAHPRRVEEKIVLDEYLGRIERELICRALARAKGNKTKAAGLLGMSRPRLYRRMVQLGLEE